MGKKIIISTNAGGIANRMKCLVSMMRLADLYNRKLYLYWFRNHTCGADFLDLFEDDFPQISEEQLQKIDKKDVKFYGDSAIEMPNSHHKYITSNTVRSRYLPGEIRDKTSKNVSIDNENNMNFKFETVPLEASKKILFYLKKIVPIKQIRMEVNNFAKKNSLKSMVGVHIRRGDLANTKSSPGRVSSDKKFIERMNELIKEEPKIKFFLCTDSEEMEEKMEKEFPGRIIKYPKTSFVRTDVQATKEGLIDLLLLSKTKRILVTYKSSFSEMAWWVGDCKPKMEIIIDPEKEKEYFKNMEKEKRKIIPKIKKIIINLIRRNQVSI